MTVTRIIAFVVIAIMIGIIAVVRPRKPRTTPQLADSVRSISIRNKDVDDLEAATRKTLITLALGFAVLVILVFISKNALWEIWRAKTRPQQVVTTATNNIDYKKKAAPLPPPRSHKWKQTTIVAPIGNCLPVTLPPGPGRFNIWPQGKILIMTRDGRTIPLAPGDIKEIGHSRSLSFCSDEDKAVEVILETFVP